MLVRKLLLSGLGTGFLPIAPGTWGSALAVAICLGVTFGMRAAGCPVWMLVSLSLIGIIAATAGCVVFGSWAVSQWGKDPSRVVLDEIAGQWVALLPVAFVLPTSRMLVFAGVAFVLFRIFDIIKPPPARQFERLKDGVGIVADDLVAGLYAGVVCLLCQWYWG